MIHSQSANGKLHIKNPILVFVICGFLSLLLFSCKNKKDSFIIDYQYDYAPLDSGHYVIYDVDSILYTYNQIQHNDTAHYQLMEMVGDTFYDNTNDLSYELNLYRRADDNSPWVYDRKWSVKRKANTFQKNEIDMRFVKLVFPPQQDEGWNGNVYIPITDPYRIFENWEYHYTDVNVPYSVNNLNFDSTITVSEVDNTNAIEKTLRKEVYAKHVGMIYQEWEYLTKTPTDDWSTGIKTGFSIKMTIKAHN